MIYHLLETDFGGSAIDCSSVRWEELNVTSHLCRKGGNLAFHLCRSLSLYWLCGTHETILQTDSTIVQKKTSPLQHRIVVYQVSEFNHFRKIFQETQKVAKGIV